MLYETKIVMTVLAIFATVIITILVLARSKYRARLDESERTREREVTKVLFEQAVPVSDCDQVTKENFKRTDLIDLYTRMRNLHLDVEHKVRLAKGSTAGQKGYNQVLIDRPLEFYINGIEGFFKTIERNLQILAEHENESAGEEELTSEQIDRVWPIYSEYCLRSGQPGQEGGRTKPLCKGGKACNVCKIPGKS